MVCKYKWEDMIIDEQHRPKSLETDVQGAHYELKALTLRNGKQFWLNYFDCETEKTINMLTISMEIILSYFIYVRSAN